MTRLDQLFNGKLPRLLISDLAGPWRVPVRAWPPAGKKMLSLPAGDPPGIERGRDWVGKGSRVLVRRALAGGLNHDGVADELADEALALFMQAYSGGHELTTVYPGVRECLDWLREREVRLAIITNKPAQFIEPLLEEKGLAGYFQWLVGGDTLPQQKPDPAALFWVMDKAGVAPGESLFVGDSRNDVRAAKAATVRCVALTYGYNHGEPIADEQPALVLDDLRELVASAPGLR
ncbi:MAG: phosphoglycolate phosphatase [Pseudomonas sp. CO183]|nr:MAG: phosphoglycolate phosphatase [Pseudomonas sp. CO183]